jgi:hypothetical protein
MLEEVEARADRRSSPASSTSPSSARRWKKDTMTEKEKEELFRHSSTPTYTLLHRLSDYSEHMSVLYQAYVKLATWNDELRGGPLPETQVRHIVRSVSRVIRSTPDVTMIVEGSWQDHLMKTIGQMPESPGIAEDLAVFRSTFPLSNATIKDWLDEGWRYVQRYPREHHFLTSHAGVLLFNSPWRDMKKATALLDQAVPLLPRDDNNLITINVMLMVTSVAFQHWYSHRGDTKKQAPFQEKATALLRRFIGPAEAAGHRDAGRACYILAMMTAGPEANTLVARGDACIKDLPKYLQDDGMEQFRTMAVDHARRQRPVPTAKETPAAAAGAAGRQGGLVLAAATTPAPKNLKGLEAASRSLRDSHSMAIMATARMGRITSVLSAAPNDRARNDTAQASAPSLRPMSLASVLKAGRDKHYPGMSVRLVVVSEMYAAACRAVIVEDEQRTSTRLAVYNLTPKQETMLQVGREIVVQHPFLRLASDGQLGLRSDKPKDELHFTSTVHDMCTNCLRQSPAGAAGMLRCGTCRIALFCDKACEENGRTRAAHQFRCLKPAEARSRQAAAGIPQ